MIDAPSVAFQLAVGEELDESRTSGKALKLALRSAMEVFGAPAGCIARRAPGREALEPLVRLPREVDWDGAELARYLGRRRPPMPDDSLVVPLPRRGRAWGVLALRLSGAGTDGALAQEMLRVGRRIERALARIDRARLAEVRERLDRKIAEQLQPRDLFYHVLHGLHSLTRYDHSAAVLRVRDGGANLRVVAEQIAWRNGGSSVVGVTIPLPAEARALLERGEVLGLDQRPDGTWRPWWGDDGPETRALAAALDYNRATGAEAEGWERSVLAAPLVTGAGLTGVIKVACRYPGFLGRYEAELVERFLPHVAIALQHLERAATLESGALEAERRSILADLARGVAHDVNNALGAALPLVQQLRADLNRGPLDPETAAEDLRQVEASLAVCRRIFGGMLNLARSAAHGSSDGNLRRAVEAMEAVLSDSARRRGVHLAVSLPERLPPVHCPQHDLEQLLWNLASNALDALEAGGRLDVVARRGPGELHLAFVDTGPGIAPEALARIEEPFYSTKAGGSGLGLAIVRSIVTRAGGTLRIESAVGAGTTVHVTLPFAVAREEGAA